MRCSRISPPIQDMIRIMQEADNQISRGDAGNRPISIISVNKSSRSYQRRIQACGYAWPEAPGCVLLRQAARPLVPSNGSVFRHYWRLAHRLASAAWPIHRRRLIPKMSYYLYRQSMSYNRFPDGSGGKNSVDRNVFDYLRIVMLDIDL